MSIIKIKDHQYRNGENRHKALWKQLEDQNIIVMNVSKSNEIISIMLDDVNLQKLIDRKLHSDFEVVVPPEYLSRKTVVIGKIDPFYPGDK